MFYQVRRKRVMEGSARWVVGGIGLIVVIMIVRGLWVTYIASADEGVNPVTIEIATGASVKEVAAQLHNAELLSAPTWFRAYGRMTGRARRIQAGQVMIVPGTNIHDLFAVLSDAGVAERQVTIIEGWTIKDIDAQLAKEGIAAEGEVTTLVHDAAFRSPYQFLTEIPDGLDIEGYAFPDTYRVFVDATARDVLTKALDEFEDRVVEKRADEIAASGRSLFEIITIASILEKEVRRPEDMKMVADIIERRLAIGMALQMDSTVNYVTGKSDPGILLADRDIDSLYNTYRYPGLPRGPISNPGEAAINAALHSDPNPYLFFLTTPDGEVVYARTNDEHAANKAKYLR